MRLEGLATVYLLAGVGLAGWVLARRGLSGRTAVDGALLVVCWPLYAPFMLAGAADAPLFEALATLRTGPLRPWLPDERALRQLSLRLVRATARVAELERVGAEPAFDPAGADARAESLAAAGQLRAAEAARRTAEHLRRIGALRDRARAELVEVEEHLRQLHAQAELMRLSGSATDARALVTALAEGIERLDAALADPVLCPPPTDDPRKIAPRRE